MAFGIFLTVIVLLFLTTGGALLSFWARKSGIHGLEIWLPLAVILSYSISPVVGIIVSCLILIGSLVLFPFALHYLLIMIMCLGGLCFSTIMFPVTSANFVMTALWLTIAYNILSNAIMFFVGHNIVHILKFAVVSIFFSWLIYAKVGWWLILLFK